jgi:predicted Ser/Thr protein kinase
MADVVIQPKAPRCLADVLAEELHWTLAERLLFVRQLALQVIALHAGGRNHRDIRAETITLDPQRQPQLGPPGGPRWFGGEHSDPEYCPPELAGAEAVELPAEIEAARTILQQHQQTLAPQRIDLYQLGVLLCRLVTEEPVMAYIYSPTAKAKVPAAARVVLARALGFDDASPLTDGPQLLRVLDEAIQQAGPLESPNSMHETPAHGSILWTPANTPAEGSPPAVTANSAAPAPNQDPLPFERLGHYQVLERIGSGGMGDVYRGYDASLDRYVAIKVLPPELARDASFVHRFRAEATAAAKVAHPNIVPVYFIGEDGGRHFFAMQYIEGESLAARLDRRKRLNVEEALVVVEHCLSALKAAHAQGLIHRDVKPANVLLDRKTKRAVLVDFGLVRTIDSSLQMTATGVVMGTCDYIAPEQARGLKVDGRADIYSLGVLMYQLLAGRLPFHAETPTAMIFQHAYEQPRPLAELVPNVPPAVVAIIARMMAKDPASRYGNCGEVLADIRAFRTGATPRAAAAGLANAAAAGATGFAGDIAQGQNQTPAKPAPSSRQVRPTRAALASDEPTLNVDLPRLVLPSHNLGKRAKDWAATTFRRHAPEVLKELQSTTQHVDGAVAEYQRRRDRVAQLLAEGLAVLADLAQQIKINAQMATAAQAQADAAANDQQRHDALAKKQQCEEDLAALRRQHEQQQHEIEDLQQQLNKAEATLAQLRSQRDVLIARLQAAEAGRQMQGEPRQSQRHPWLVPIAGGTSVLVLMLWLLLLPRAAEPPQVAELPQPPARPQPADKAIAPTPSDRVGTSQPVSRVLAQRQALMIGNTPYWETLADIARQKGMAVGTSFNTRYDEYLPLAKGHVLLIETHDRIPLVPLSVLEQFYPGASTGLNTSEGVVSIGNTLIAFVEFSRLLPDRIFDSPGAGLPQRHAFIVGNRPYWELLTDMARRKGMAVGTSFNTRYDEHLPQAKGQVLLVETHDRIPVVPLSILDNFYPGASEGLNAPEGIVSIDSTLIVFVDFSRLLGPAVVDAARRTPTGKPLAADTDRPRVVVTSPRNNDMEVDPSLSEIRVVFSRAMRKGYSVSGADAFSYSSRERRSWYFEDDKTFVLPAILQPNTHYAISLNPKGHSLSFQDLDGRPLATFDLVFRTRSQAKAEAEADIPGVVVLPEDAPKSGDQVVEGIGWGRFRVGVSRDELISVFGPLETTPGGQRTGWITRRHIDFWFDKADHAVEVRFVEGFRLLLSSGIGIGSSEREVLLAYGSPDRVVNQPQAKMLEFDKRGVLVWLMDGKVTSFTVMRPSPTTTN